MSSYPAKAFLVDAGTCRPLGIGAGSRHPCQKVEMRLGDVAKLGGEGAVQVRPTVTDRIVVGGTFQRQTGGEHAKEPRRLPVRKANGTDVGDTIEEII